MAVAGTVAVNLVANTQSFVSGMDNAMRVFDQWRASIGNAISAGASFVENGLNRIVGALSVMGPAQAEQIDQMSKMSERFNIATETLAGLEHQANLSGISFKELETGLQRFQKAIIDGADGVKESSDAFKRLGLDARRLVGQDLGDSLKQVADAFVRVNDATVIGASGFDLFGRQGMRIVQLLKDGSESIRAYEAEAEKLGLTFSKFDGKQVEAANDALTRIRSVLDGALRKVIIELAPYIQALADEFVKWATTGVPLSTRIVEALTTVGSVISRLIDFCAVLGGVFQVAFGVSIKLTAALAQTLGLVVQAIEKVISLTTLGFVSSDFGERIRGWANDAYHFGQSMVDAGERMADNGWDGKYGQMFDAWANDVRNAAEQARLSMDATARAMAEQASYATGEWQRAGDSLAKALEEIDKELQAVKEGNDKKARALEEQASKQERLAKMAKEERQYLDEIVNIEWARVNGYDELAKRLQDILDTRKAETKELETQRDIEKQRSDYIQNRLRPMLQGLNAGADEAKRSQDRVRALEREQALLQAKDDFARDLLRLEQERDDRLEQAGDNSIEQQAVMQSYNAKLADLYKRQADDAQRRLEQEARTTQEKARQNQLSKEALDINKGFVAMPGTGGLFGFGRAPEGPRAPTFFDVKPKVKKAEAPGLKTDVQDVAQGIKDTAPQVASTTKALVQVRTMYAKLTNEVIKMANEASTSASAMSEATTTAVTSLAKGQADLRAEVRALRERMKQGADLGLQGG